MTIKLYSKGIVVTILLILVLAICIVGTVNGQNRTKIRNHTAYEKAMEKEYVQKIKRSLKEMGFGNSGVTMSYTMEQDGKKEYTVTIHHNKISLLTGKEKKQLLEECQEISFPEEECIIYHDFLETES